MKKGIILIALTFLIITSVLLASCSSSTTTTTQTTATTTASTNTTATAPASTTTSTTSVAPVTTAVSTTSTGNWWDSLGTPQYGGTLTISLQDDITSFDDGNPVGGQEQVNNAWEDSLVCDDWTQDPSVFSYQIDFRPSNYEVGDVAADWEFTNPTTIVMNLNQNVYWQDIAPVNGRQYVASDVVYYFDRLYGLGEGFTTPLSTNTSWAILQSVVATGSYTVTFNFQGASEESICETMYGPMGGTEEASEQVAQYTTASNPVMTSWHSAMGTGPFILKDWVDSSEMTLDKNTSYWGTDERYPQNQLPYINELDILIIPNESTALAAVRTGKIGVIDSLTIQQAQQLVQTNPDLTQITYAGGGPYTIDPKVNETPFSDIRVRQAMQMALNLPQIASTYYQGAASPYPSTMTSMYITGWTYPYTSWPASLQATYAYNPTGAEQLLTAAGYSSGFNTNIVASSSADLGLLQIIQSEEASIGINISITEMDPATFNSYVRGLKAPDLAYETSLGFSFPPLMGFRRWQAGADVDWDEVNDPAWNALYAQALAATTVAQTQQIVVQANQYEAQQQWDVSLPNPSQLAVCQPYLKGYNAQTFSISSPYGVLCIGFYCSRFWITQ